MAASFYPTAVFFMSVFLVSEFFSKAFSQTLYPQNIQTFYPFPPPPSPFILTPPSVATTPSSDESSVRAAVGRAIGATAATTLVLSGLVFFLIFRFTRRRRDNVVVGNSNGGMNQVLPLSDGFVRVNGNFKGVIVTENGLDVLYWRSLEEGGDRINFKKQIYRSVKDEDEEKRRVNGREKRPSSSPPVQEIPLLRGESSTSHSPIWAEKDPVIDKPHSISIAMVENRDSSIEFRKQESIPPVLPPPPPMKPLLAIGTAPKGKTIADSPPAALNIKVLATTPSLPPPPISVASPSTSQPPPPPIIPDSSKRSSSLGEDPSSGKVNSGTKLKPLHWDKMNPDSDQSMVWDKIDKGSRKFDGDLMEALFGYVATNRKSPREEKSKPPSQIFILDPSKSQNTAIVLKSLGVTRKEIIDALMDGQGLTSDTIEKLAKIAPTPEESSQILGFHGDITRLADAESFLYHLLKAVPSAFIRFNAMLFRTTYNTEVSQIRESLQSFESACKELRSRGMFFKLLEAVLKAGNRLNAATSRGNAQAFNLTALRKLSDVKSSDGKTTLLQFVVQEVVRAEGKRCALNRNRSLSRMNSLNSDQQNDDEEREYMILGLPVIGGLSAEFSNVKKAATLVYSVTKTVSNLVTQMSEIQKMVAQCGSEDGFSRVMKGFLGTAELEMNVVEEEEARVMELVKRTTDYYQVGGSSKDNVDNPLQLFVIIRDFLAMVDEVCVDIARNVQNKRTGSFSAGSAGSGSPRVFRFPKLPANFMSENTRSSSSE